MNKNENENENETQRNVTEGNVVMENAKIEVIKYGNLV